MPGSYPKTGTHYLQVLFPELQKRQMVRARKRRLRTSVLKSLASTASPFGTLLLPDGGINDEVHPLPLSGMPQRHLVALVAAPVTWLKP